MITDIALSKDCFQKIEGFVLKSSSLYQEKLIWIPWTHIRLGENLAYYDRTQSPTQLDDTILSKSFFFKKSLENKPVYTTNGIEVGLLKDIYISVDEGAIDCLQCSDGMFQDLIKGRIILPIQGKIRVEHNGLFIQKEWLEESFLTKKGGVDA